MALATVSLNTPTPGSPTSISPLGFCKTRFTTYARMTAGLIVVAICVMALIYSIITKASVALSALFAGGTLVALFVLWQMFEFRNSKTHEQNNQDQRQETTRLHAEVDALNDTVSLFDEQYKELQKGFRGQIQALEDLKTDFERQQNAHIGKLNALVGLLSGVEQAAAGNHTKLAENLQIFTENLAPFKAEVQALKDARQGLTDTVETKFGEQLDAFIKSVQPFISLFEQLAKWKDSTKEIGEQIKQLQEVQKSVKEATTDQRELLEELAKIREQIARSEVVYQGLEREISRLTDTRDTLDKGLERLQKMLDQLEGDTVQIAEFRKHLDKLKRYSLPLKETDEKN